MGGSRWQAPQKQQRHPSCFSGSRHAAGDISDRNSHGNWNSPLTTSSAGGTYLIYRPVPGFHLSNSPMKWNSKPAVKSWILIDRSIMHIAFGNSLHSFPAHSGTILQLMLQKNAWALSHPLWKSYLDRGTESPPGLRKHSNFNHHRKDLEGLTSAEWPQAKLKLS